VDPFAKAALILGNNSTPADVVEEVESKGARYFLSIEGLDYGPYNFDEVVEQLHSDKINEFTSALDRKTQIRRPLKEIPTFAAAVADYIPVREERLRLENERRAQMVETAKTAGRWTVYAGVGAGLLVGLFFWVYWTFIRPEPAKLPEEALVADMSQTFKMQPPPKEFEEINVDQNIFAALFEGRKTRRGKKGKRRQGRIKGRGGSNAQDQGEEEDITEVDFNSSGGTDHVLTDAEVTRGVLAQFGSIQSCLMPELKRNPNFRGVRVKFFIKPTGTTGGVSVLEGKYNSGQVGSCLKSRFRGMKFPAHGGFNRGVIFPIIVK
jgi:hypothetical protein